MSDNELPYHLHFAVIHNGNGYLARMSSDQPFNEGFPTHLSFRCLDNEAGASCPGPHDADGDVTVPFVAPATYERLRLADLEMS